MNFSDRFNFDRPGKFLLSEFFLQDIVVIVFVLIQVHLKKTKMGKNVFWYVVTSFHLVQPTLIKLAQISLKDTILLHIF